MSKVGLFYAPKGGSTEEVAHKIAEAIGSDQVDLHFVGSTDIEKIKAYDNIILGTATVDNDAWDGKHPRNNWDVIFPELRDVNFSGKTVALFALGNQVMYSGHFVDSLGQFGEVMLERGANLVGYADPDDYDFEESEGLKDGKFMGLPIDEDTESDKTPERIQAWVEQIKPEMGF